MKPFVNIFSDSLGLVHSVDVLEDNMEHVLTHKVSVIGCIRLVDCYWVGKHCFSHGGPDVTIYLLFDQLYWLVCFHKLLRDAVIFITRGCDSTIDQVFCITVTFLRLLIDILKIIFFVVFLFVLFFNFIHDTLLFGIIHSFFLWFRLILNLNFDCWSRGSGLVLIVWLD